MSGQEEFLHRLAIRCDLGSFVDILPAFGQKKFILWTVMEYEDKAFGGVDWNGAAAEDKRFCYNPPANYKVLANRSSYWPTGWTW